MKPSDHPYLQHDGIIAFAHRGGSERWPENSLPAFQEAVDLGYRYLETDVQATRDGVLLVFHDHLLDRMTERRGRICDLDYEETRKLRLDGSELIPRLEDVLSAFPDTRFSIDIKNDNAVEPLLSLVKRADIIGRVCLNAFSTPCLKFLREQAGPHLCTSLGPTEIAALRISSWAGSFGKRLHDFGGACVQVPLRRYGIELVDRRLLDRAHAVGLPVHVWTINEATEMERLLDLGVDGLMTDRAALLKTVLIKRGIWSGREKSD